MNAIGGILLLLVIWFLWNMAPSGYQRFSDQLKNLWGNGSTYKLKVGLGTLLWVVTCGLIFQYLSDKWIATQILLTVHAVFFAIYELAGQSRDSAKLDEILREQARLKEVQLATGEGWSRWDVLRKFKSTLYFRQFGRMQTTQGWRCSACSKNLYKEKDAEVDHILPVSTYPHLRFTESNLQVLCRSCNSTKHAYDGDDWKKVVHKRRRQRNKKKKEGDA